MERAKFYSKEDLSIVMHLERAEEVLSNYKEEHVYKDVNDILELYNVKLLIDNGLELKSWPESLVVNFKQKTSIIGKNIVGFFRNQPEIDDLCLKVSREYEDDFWTVLEKFGLRDIITDERLEKILSIKPGEIENILHCKNIVKEHDGQLAEFLLHYEKTTNLLLNRYLVVDMKSYQAPLYIPESLDEEQKRKIVEDYLNSGKASLVNVRTIMQSKDVQGFSLTPKIRLLAKKLEKKLATIPKDAIVSAIQTGFTIEFSKQTGIPYKQYSCEDLVLKYVYSEEYLNSLNEKELLLTFISCFDYLDEHGFVNFRYNWNESYSIERLFMHEIHGVYPINDAFRMKNNIALAQIAMFDSYLRRKGNTIESVIKAFYENYLRERFNYPAIAINFANDSELYINRDKAIAPEIESIVKQYNLFVEEGEIDSELFQMSMPLPISLSKSLLWGKHKYVVWGNKNNQVLTPMNLLFSDQALLSFVEPFKNAHYRTLYNLLMNENEVLYVNYEEHQRPKVDFLLSNGYLVNEGGFIRLAKTPKIEILHYMYKQGEIAYYYHNPDVRAEIDKMVEDDILKYDDYLLSPTERHYVNFFMNSAEFSNGLQLRNKYLHGVVSCLDSDDVHQKNYYYFLLVLIVILLKIYEDLKLADWLKKSSTK